MIFLLADFEGNVFLFDVGVGELVYLEGEHEEASASGVDGDRGCYVLLIHNMICRTV